MKSFQYVPELDGIRAIAITLVLFSHANFQVGAYGYFGVHVFFTLSGFLITTILLNEKEKGSFSIKRFYFRRAFRLLPALILFLLFIQGYNLFFESGESKKVIQSEIWASLFYVYNISWLWNEGKLITHMWSLAIEEQFYLIWPWIILLFTSRKTFTWVLAVFIFFSTFIKFPIWNSIIDESLLIGCLGAVLNQRGSFELPKSVNLLMIALLLLIGIAFPSGSIPHSKYISLLVGLTLIFPIISYANGQVSPILSSSIFIYLGKISYSLYLWHVPIFKWFKWYSPLEPWQSFILKFTVTFLISMASYHWIEKPLIAFGRSLTKNKE